MTQARCYTIAAFSLCVIAAGCSILSGVSQLHKSAKGTVHLTEVNDWSFEAHHPALINQTTMLKVVKGLLADAEPHALVPTPASGSRPMRIFSDEDAEFLAPLLAKGLSQAKPEQMVGFTVFSSAGSSTEPTAGTLYVRQGFLYLTIAPSSGRKVSGFSPSSAVRIEKAPSYASLGAAGAIALVIDQQVLTSVPMPGPLPVGAAPTSTLPRARHAVPISKSAVTQDVPAAAEIPSGGAPTSGGGFASTSLTNDELLLKKLDELRQARENNKMKDSEILMLRKEINRMKRELRERTAELKAMKPSKTSTRSSSKKKQAKVQPSR